VCVCVCVCVLTDRQTLHRFDRRLLRLGDGERAIRPRDADAREEMLTHTQTHTRGLRSSLCTWVAHMQHVGAAGS